MQLLSLFEYRRAKDNVNFIYWVSRTACEPVQDTDKWEVLGIPQVSSLSNIIQGYYYATEPSACGEIQGSKILNLF